MGSTAETTKTDSPGGLVPNRHFLRPADFSRATLAKSGIPVTREGHRVQASPEQLNRWMERETSEPVHIATESADLSSELRRGLFYVKKQKAQSKKESRITPSPEGPNKTRPNKNHAETGKGTTSVMPQSAHY